MELCLIVLELELTAGAWLTTDATDKCINTSTGTHLNDQIFGVTL